MKTDLSLRLLYKRMILVGFIVAVGSLYFKSFSVTMGVVAGLILALANFWLIQRAVGGLLAGERSSMAGLYVVKITAILGVLFLLIGVAKLDPIGLMTGFSVLVFVTTTSGQRVLNESSVEDAEIGADLESIDG
jgi:hypothetical protein